MRKARGGTARWIRGAGSLLFALSVCGHDSLTAQAGADSTVRAVAAPARGAHAPHAASASPLLPAGHWAVRA
ncbi:MAG: hypothetical protein KY467_11790, partial [Gemmatimonadetes bacterium]|nr:hypothetical protein [Gemmatimonadota bacterium]